jgi:regulator of protease activity HflC (stomatin/prohibitin superfamily)
MERSIQKTGLVNLLLLLAAGVSGFLAARHGQSLAGQVTMLFTGLGFCVAAVSWFQMRLEDNEKLERLELESLAKGHAGTAMFENKESELFPVRRSREQFERFFVPIFTVVLCLGQAGGAYFLWQWLAKGAATAQVKEPMIPMFLFFLLALVLFLVGRFSATIARLGGHRLLRPGASYVLLNAFLCSVVGVGLVFVQAGFAKADLYIAYVVCAILGLVAAETTVNLVLEMYRPRVKGKVERPLYESRLVGLLGQPEGLVTTAAQALDYQFGFKVSETWFYKFAEQAVGMVALAQILVLGLSTCVVFIDAGEEGLLERFGKPVEGRTLLGAGAHFKLPWPVDRVYRYRTEQIQSFNVGFTPDPKRQEEKVIVWTVSHTKEENFLVANREPGAEATNSAAAGGVNSATKRTPPVSLLTVSIPVQFQITNLLDWAYANEDASSLLADVANREVVRYLAGADMIELMSRKRLEASGELSRRIQAAADEHRLGARIISVGLQDIHPPVKVAPEFEKVVGAVQAKQAKILSAMADDVRTNAAARIQATNALNRAESHRVRQEIGALAQAALFTNQVPAFATAPSVYAERSYLRTFERASAGARKYVLLATNTHDVLQFDLQDKLRKDILEDIVVPPSKPTK